MSEAHGPIDYVMLQFPEGSALDGAGRAVRDLIDQGVVQLYDVLVLHKGADGTLVEVDLAEAGSPDGLAGFAGARSGLLDDEDVEAAGALLDPGTIGAVLVFENTWARRFVAETLQAGGDVIASARIPATDVVAALDAQD